MSQSSLRPDMRRLLDSHEQLALCLDFDGTLAPIVTEPDDAALPADTESLLHDLADMPSAELAVISGRALSDVRDRVGIEEIAYAGNHGIELQQDGEVFVHPATEEHRKSLERICRQLTRELEPLSGVFLEDKNATATVHYRQADPDDIQLIISTVERIVAHEDTLRTTTGNKIIEIRPDIDQAKGEAVETLVDNGPATVVVYIGDDETDVDAFRALSSMAGENVAIAVGDRRPEAEYVLDSPAAVEEFLDWLSDELVS